MPFGNASPVQGAVAKSKIFDGGVVNTNPCKGRFINPSVSLTAASSLCTREPMRCGTNARCTTGGAGGNRGFSAMMLVERHRNGIAKVCDVRKHGIRLAALSTFFPRARLGCAAQATLYSPLYITNPQKRSPKRTFRGSLLCMGDGSAITQCPEPSWRWRPSGSRQRWRRASCCPAGRTRRRRRSRP